MLRSGWLAIAATIALDSLYGVDALTRSHSLMDASWMKAR
jgi:hypothetical protein